MKRQKKKPQKSVARQTAPKSKVTEPVRDIDRREFFGKMRNFPLYGAIGGGVAWYFVKEVDAAICEGDLSRIGNGVPIVVQVHDPQCPRCVALQQKARDAVSNFKD